MTSVGEHDIMNVRSKSELTKNSQLKKRDFEFYREYIEYNKRFYKNQGVYLKKHKIFKVILPFSPKMKLFTSKAGLPDFNIKSGGFSTSAVAVIGYSVVVFLFGHAEHGTSYAEDTPK